ncbi:MAG: hypothetical protein EG825_08465 [Rhodocyclaceae bacterium]|nr:hypothetical protein [Rhodocyclaceae bacterium]
MPIEFKLKDSARLAFAVSAAFPLGAYAVGAGKVDFSVGNVAAVAADGSRRALGKGAEVNSGETIDTGDGRAQVRFTDGAQVSLQPQTQFRVDDYRFNGRPDGEEKGFFSLLKGGLRTITGLVGRSNRQNYKITTQVATIGIRGTEYSANLNNGLSVTTGEGSVEVCNAAGCMILNSGESGFVVSGGSTPTRTEIKTSLPPSNTSESGTVKYEIIKGNEGLASMLPKLESGAGYAISASGMYADGGEGSSTYYPWTYAPGVANFAPSGEFLQLSADGGEGSVDGLTAGTSASFFTDGVIGWGRWTGGVENYGGSVYPTSDIHYVVGKLTPSADMLALSSGYMVGTYSLIGYTYPTSSTGAIGGPGSVAATLQADFGGGSVNGTLAVALGGQNLSSVWNGSISGSTFDGSGSNSASIAGFFAGAGASRAGLTYQFTGTAIGTVSGAAAFKQTGLSPSPY